MFLWSWTRVWRQSDSSWWCGLMRKIRNKTILLCILPHAVLEKGPILWKCTLYYTAAIILMKIINIYSLACDGLWTNIQKSFKIKVYFSFGGKTEIDMDKGSDIINAAGGSPCEKFRKGSRCHLLNLINPLSVRNDHLPKKIAEGFRSQPGRAKGFGIWHHKLVQGEHRIQVHHK